jgi:hypothetical protein
MANNRWDKLRDRIAERAIATSDTMVDKIKGGSTPPGKKRMDPDRAMHDYLLLAQPPTMLTPELAAEADALWQKKFAGKSRADIAEWCIDMERKRLQRAGPLGAFREDELPVTVVEGNLPQRYLASLQAEQAMGAPAGPSGPSAGVAPPTAPTPAQAATPMGGTVG